VQDSTNSNSDCFSGTEKKSSNADGSGVKGSGAKKVRAGKPPTGAASGGKSGTTNLPRINSAEKKNAGNTNGSARGGVNNNGSARSNPNSAGKAFSSAGKQSANSSAMKNSGVKNNNTNSGRKPSPMTEKSNSGLKNKTPSPGVKSVKSNVGSSEKKKKASPVRVGGLIAAAQNAAKADEKAAGGEKAGEKTDEEEEAYEDDFEADAASLDAATRSPKTSDSPMNAKKSITSGSINCNGVDLTPGEGRQSASGELGEVQLGIAGVEGISNLDLITTTATPPNNRNSKVSGRSTQQNSGRNTGRQTQQNSTQNSQRNTARNSTVGSLESSNASESSGGKESNFTGSSAGKSSCKVESVLISQNSARNEYLATSLSDGLFPRMSSLDEGIENENTEDLNSENIASDANNDVGGTPPLKGYTGNITQDIEEDIAGGKKEIALEKRGRQTIRDGKDGGEDLEGVEIPEVLESSPEKGGEKEEVEVVAEGR
jgi:hypothetical protein